MHKVRCDAVTGEACEFEAQGDSVDVAKEKLLAHIAKKHADHFPDLNRVDTKKELSEKIEAAVFE